MFIQSAVHCMSKSANQVSPIPQFYSNFNPFLRINICISVYFLLVSSRQKALDRNSYFLSLISSILSLLNMFNVLLNNSSFIPML